MNKLFTIIIVTVLTAFSHSAMAQSGRVVLLEFQNRTAVSLEITAKNITTKGMPDNCVLTIPKNPFTVAANSTVSVRGTYNGCPPVSFVFASNFFVQFQADHLKKKFNTFVPYIHFICSSDEMGCSSNMNSFPLVIQQNNKTIKISAEDIGSAQPFIFRFTHPSQ